MESRIFTYSTTRNSKLPVPPNKILGVLLLLLLALGGCRSVWLSTEGIDTDDFGDIRSVLEPDIQKLFNEARKEFEHDGYGWYTMDQRLAREEYGILYLHIIQFEEDDGTTYEVLFAFTSGVRGFGGGYYYTPSSKLPPVAPTYGVVCSKQVDDFWYAFHTVDSQEPPDPKDCPEDTQYHQ
jgi:hypothetical protein